MTNPVTSEARVAFAPLQQATSQDVYAVGTLGQSSLDNVVTNCLTSGVGYTGMPVTAVGTTGLSVGTGYLIKGGPAYALRDPYPIDLSAVINAAPDSSKSTIVLIVADGQESYTSETRTFLDKSKQPTNPADPWPTTTAATNTRGVRTAILSTVAGSADVQPQTPTYGANLCLIATVVVSNTAIVSITQETGQQITSLAQLAVVVNGLSDFEASITPVINALMSSVSALALKTADQLQALYAEIGNLQSRLTAVEAQLSAPQSILRDQDFFTDATKSLTTAAGYNATVGQGLTFPPSTTASVNLAPQNTLASNLAQGYSGYLIPAFTEVAGATSAAFLAGSVPATQFLYFNTFAVHAASFFVRGFGYWRMRWGGALIPLSIAQLIVAGVPGLIFVNNPATLAYQAIWGPWYVTTTELIRSPGYWRDLSARGYWTPIVATNPVSQPPICQTYTPSGDVMVTSVEVGINRVGSSGDVRMVLTLSQNGNPDTTNTLADVTVPFANMGQFSTKFTLPLPTLVKGGQTVHLIIYTSGGHSVRTVPLGRVAVFAGPILVYTVGGWAQIQTALEIGMRINVARFANVSTRVPANVLALAGGIDTVDIAAQAIVPDGCSIDYEGQIGGVYVPIEENNSGPHPLSGRPTTLPINIVLSGTASTAPIITLAGSYAMVSHQSTAFQHNSISYTPPVNARVVTKSAIVDSWNPTFHTLTASLQTGAGYATATAPTTVVDQIQPDGSLLRTWNWTFGSATVVSGEFILTGTTSDSTKVFSVRQSNTAMTT